MKKKIQEFILQIGGQPGYSGKEKTMYITDPMKGENVQSIEACVYTIFGFDIPFKLKTN